MATWHTSRPRQCLLLAPSTHSPTTVPSWNLPTHHTISGPPSLHTCPMCPPTHTHPTRTWLPAPSWHPTRHCCRSLLRALAHQDRTHPRRQWAWAFPQTHPRSEPRHAPSPPAPQTSEPTGSPTRTELGPAPTLAAPPGQSSRGAAIFASTTSDTARTSSAGTRSARNQRAEASPARRIWLAMRPSTTPVSCVTGMAATVSSAASTTCAITSSGYISKHPASHQRLRKPSTSMSLSRHRPLHRRSNQRGSDASRQHATFLRPLRLVAGLRFLFFFFFLLLF
jgi:hypothetical protein